MITGAAPAFNSEGYAGTARCPRGGLSIGVQASSCHMRSDLSDAAVIFVKHDSGQTKARPDRRTGRSTKYTGGLLSSYAEAQPLPHTAISPESLDAEDDRRH